MCNLAKALLKLPQNSSSASVILKENSLRLRNWDILVSLWGLYNKSISLLLFQNISKSKLRQIRLMFRELRKDWKLKHWSIQSYFPHLYQNFKRTIHPKISILSSLNNNHQHTWSMWEKESFGQHPLQTAITMCFKWKSDLNFGFFFTQSCRKALEDMEYNAQVIRTLLWNLYGGF